MVINDTSTNKEIDTKDSSGNPPSAPGDSLQVEVGSDVLDQNVTMGMSTREDPIGGEVNSPGMHESWSPSSR